MIPHVPVNDSQKFEGLKQRAISLDSAMVCGYTLLLVVQGRGWGMVGCNMCRLRHGMMCLECCSAWPACPTGPEVAHPAASQKLIHAGALAHTLQAPPPCVLLGMRALKKQGRLLLGSWRGIYCLPQQDLLMDLHMFFFEQALHSEILQNNIAPQHSSQVAYNGMLRHPLAVAWSW